MKSPILTFFLALTAMLSMSAQSNIPQPTHRLIYVAADAFSLPVLVGEVFYYFNGNGDKYEEKYNSWDGTNWNLASRTYYTLNTNGNPTLILTRSWDTATSMLVDNNRTTKQYNANGLLTFEKYEIWNNTDGVWDTRTFELIIFNDFGLELEHTEQTFSDGVQKFWYHNIYTYDSNNRLSEKIYIEYSNGVQTSGQHDFITYDGTNRKSEIITQIWEAGVWRNARKTNYSYVGVDANNYQTLDHPWDETNSTWGAPEYHGTVTATPLLRVSVGERLDSGNWVPYGRNTLSYNNSGQILIDLYEYWDVNSVIWVPNSRTVNTYNNAGQDLTNSNERWDYNGGYWKTDFKWEGSYNADHSQKEIKVYKREGVDLLFLWIIADYDYGTYAVSVHSPALQTNVSIYPNPTADFVQVEMEGNGLSNITLLDLRGNVIARNIATSNTVQISLIGQPAGTYLLRVEQGGAIKVLPVLKK